MTQPRTMLDKIWSQHVVKGRRAVVRAIVVPGSSGVKRQAEAEGLDRIFLEAGFEWRDSSCSMCGGSNGDMVPRGERSASTTNRNFEGRQGPGVGRFEDGLALTAKAPRPPRESRTIINCQGAEGRRNRRKNF